ncbi:MAG TPA: DMT family transporter [Burkholderiaceae bacterium]|nr:DMT family transporter [Burkholderiaceae bacterium]
MDGPTAWRTLGLTAVAMVAFAANSLLCRLALQGQAIDPASFGSVRLLSGALVLALLVRLRAGAAPAARRDWVAASMLWLYVACFSYAYLWLSAGTGALVLFGAVQLTMFGVGLARGERFSAAAWAGLALAVGGLVALVLPGVSAPSPAGAALMALAGLAWGVYTLRGRGAGDPTAVTAGNFLRAAPLALALSVLMAAHFHASARGIVLAAASGALASGLGYAVWYAALRGLSALRAATVQLSVPPLAALGGVLWLSEPLTTRLAASSLAILGGIAIVLASRARMR